MTNMNTALEKRGETKHMKLFAAVLAEAISNPRAKRGGIQMENRSNQFISGRGNIAYIAMELVLSMHGPWEVRLVLIESQGD